MTFDAARDWGDRYAQPGSPTSGEMPVVRIRGAAPPRRCVCNESDVTAGDRGESFFCRQHRAATLEAQYRFLPALLHVRSSPRFERGDLRWVVLVDDDSFVFAERLRAPADAARAESAYGFSNVHVDLGIVTSVDADVEIDIDVDVLFTLDVDVLGR